MKNCSDAPALHLEILSPNPRRHILSKLVFAVSLVPSRRIQEYYLGKVYIFLPNPYTFTIHDYLSLSFYAAKYLLS